MEISTLNTKKGAAKGAFLHLVHPAYGHKLYSGDGANELGELIDADSAVKVGCKVIGGESESARQKLLEMNRSKLKGKGGDDEEKSLKFIASLITEFSGLTKDSKPLDATEENKLEFLRQSDDFVRQVADFSADRANFFGTA